MSRILTLAAVLLMATATGCQKAPIAPAASLANTQVAAQESNGPKSHKLTPAQEAEATARIMKAFPADAVSNLKLRGYKRGGLNLLGKYYVSFELTLKTEAGSEGIHGTYSPGQADLTRTLTKAQQAEVDALVKKAYTDEQRHHHLTWGIDRNGKLFAGVQITVWTGPRETKNVYYNYDFQTKAFTEKPADKK